MNVIFANLSKVFNKFVNPLTKLIYDVYKNSWPR